MGEATKIQWCDATWNPWRGCQKISPGCAHCYAEAMSKRNPKVLGEWGPNGTRVIASEAKWREPLKWDREAAAAGVRRKVFCASLADVFEDRDELMAPRDRLWSLINRTLNLDWLLLTKRPEVARNYIDATLMGHETPPNVWLGVSCEDQATADERIPILLRVPAAVRFLSCEPLLGPIDLTRLNNGGGETYNALTAEVTTHRGHSFKASDTRPIDWAIIGGESGPGARPCDMKWIRSIVDQCKAAAVPVFVKQMGSRPVEEVPVGTPLGEMLGDRRITLRDPKGGSMDEWPDDALKVRQFPAPVRA